MKPLLRLAVAVSVVVACKPSTSFKGSPPQKQDQKPAVVVGPTSPVVPPGPGGPTLGEPTDGQPANPGSPSVPPGGSLSCAIAKAAPFNATGRHGGGNAPRLSGAFRDQISASGQTVFAANSAALGSVSGQGGNGVWCLESLGNDGATSGTLFTDASGNFDAQIPLFCGRQRLVLAWRGNGGNGGDTIEIDRPDCQRTGIRLTLTWADGARDFEAHLIKAGGKINNPGDDDRDCTWTNKTPSWGAKKDVDWTSDRGVENIFVNEPPSSTYDVYVEYWADGVEQAPELTFNVNGKTSVHRPRAMRPQEVWHAATIEWPSGNVQLKNEVIDCKNSWDSGCTLSLPR